MKTIASLFACTVSRAGLFAIGLAAGVAAGPAQAGDEGVYGPAAPPNSAFIRVFNATNRDGLEARIASETLNDIGAYAASEFVFLSPGQHLLAIGSVSKPVTLQKNRYYTAVMSGTDIRMLENARYDGRLKSLVILYNLTEGAKLSLRTADGKTPVVDAVAPGAYGTREVNAVKVGFALYDGNSKVADVRPVLLERGKAVSLFVSGNRERPIVVPVVN